VRSKAIETAPRRKAPRSIRGLPPCDRHAWSGTSAQAYPGTKPRGDGSGGAGGRCHADPPWTGPMSEAAAAGGAGALARPYRWAGFAIGFGLGGFFDGILLHQVLQWHHLLSGLQSARFQDIRVQILADGLFHLVMYVVTAAGLVLLWRTRSLFARTGAERR